MNIHGMQRMLGALLSAVIVISSVMFSPLVQAAKTHYADDALVRDLKAGKLTVREAQLLQARRHPVAAGPGKQYPAVKHDRPLHVRPGKAVARHGTVLVQPRRRAPVRHLSRPHPQHGVRARATPAATGGRHAVHRKPARTGMMPVNMAGDGHHASPVGHHRAIKYIR
jgi:hypothetical protein